MKKQTKLEAIEAFKTQRKILKAKAIETEKLQNQTDNFFTNLCEDIYAKIDDLRDTIKEYEKNL